MNTEHLQGMRGPKRSGRNGLEIAWVRVTISLYITPVSILRRPWKFFRNTGSSWVWTKTRRREFETPLAPISPWAPMEGGLGVWRENKERTVTQQQRLCVFLGAEWITGTSRKWVKFAFRAPSFLFLGLLPPLGKPSHTAYLLFSPLGNPVLNHLCLVVIWKLGSLSGTCVHLQLCLELSLFSLKKE